MSQYLPMYARKAHLETILCSQNRLSASFNTLGLMEQNLCMPRNKSKAHNVVWLVVWDGICQCKKKQTSYNCYWSK